MLFDFPAFALVFFFGGMMAALFSYITYRRRPAPGASAFTFFALVIAIWTIFRALEAGAIEIGDKVFWAKMMYFGTGLSGVSWLIFTLDYTGSKWPGQTRQRLLLFIVPLLSYIAIWNNDIWGLFWTHIYASPGTNGTILVYEHGWVFWVLASYNYALILGGIYVIWRYLLRHRQMFRWQFVFLVLATLVPLFSNLIYLAGLSPVKGLDLTPFAFSVSGMIYSVIIFRYRFPDVVPVARNVLVEKMPDGILVMDKEGTVVDVNPAIEKVTGIERRNLSGHTLKQVWPRLDKIISGKRDKDRTAEFELELPDKYLEIKITSLLDSKQSAVGELLVVRDISERRKMEQTVRESESRYQTLVEQSNEMVLMVQNWEVKFTNHTLLELTGFSREEVVGKPFLNLVAEEDRNNVEERHYKRKEGQAVEDIYEIRLLCKNGEKRETEISVGEIVYEGVLAHIVSARDITERRLTQRKLEGLYEEEKRLRGSLQEEIEKRSKYTRALVHELNTPLTSILASGELLETEVDEPTQSALVKNIRKASYNLKQRVDELIELARGEIGILKINAIPVDMTGLLREVEEEMQPVAREKNLELVVEVEGGLPAALGDRAKLRQVLVNLISNGLKFTQAGKVEVQERRVGESVEVKVKDTGRGITPEEMENLFDPYRRKVNEGQELGGMGIGLTLSKMYVELHGGKIEVKSEAGQGSTFTFRVPLYRLKTNSTVKKVQT